MTIGAVGFVGLGQMGSLMAARLLDWPGGLRVYDVDAGATTKLREQGAQVAASAEELGASVDLVSVMVRDDEQVHDVCARLVASMRPGSVIALHSTVRADTAVDVAAGASSRGIEVLDAPVSGGVVGASSGRLAVMVGGDRATYERSRDVLRRWAELVVHVGSVGAGTRAKLARNLLGFVGYGAAAEAQRLAERAGIDLRKLGAVVRHTDAVTGGPGAIMLRDTTAPLDVGDPLYAVLAHTRDLGEKDLTLALELGSELGVELPFARLALDGLAAGLGLLDEEA